MKTSACNMAIRSLISAIVLLCAAHGAFAAMTQYSVASGETFTFQGEHNAETVELTVNAGATMNFPASGNVYAFVYLKGSGTVVFQKPTGYKGGDQVLFHRGLAADSGIKVVVKDVTTVNIGWANPPSDLHYPVVDVANMSFEEAGGKLHLTEKTTVRNLPESFDIAAGATVALQGSNPLKLGSSFELADYDAVVLMRSAIPDGCRITVQPGRTLALKPALTATRGGSYDWNWTGTKSYFNEAFSIALGGKGARVLCRNTANELRLFTPVTGVGEVVFKPDTSVSCNLIFRGRTYTASGASPVSIPINTANEPAPDNSWQKKVSHWFDASETDTIVPFSFDPNTAFGWSGAKNEFNGSQIVIGWKDKKEGSGISLYNKRIWDNSTDYTKMKADYNIQVMPYLVESGLNGLPYLSFGSFGSNKAGVKYDSNGNLASATEARRLWVWNNAAPTGNSKASGSTTTFKPKYCIMVFGSQNGGGKAILGDASGTGNGNLARPNGKTTDAWTYYDSGCSFKVDGVSVAPKTDHPSGGWQIVSIDMTAANIVINGLGNHQESTTQTFGGQNYAEVIFFDEAPEEDERMACEAYLAEKWGLKSTRSFRGGAESFSELSGGEGTTVKIDDYATDDITGSNVSYATPSEMTLAGNYRGTINIAEGKTLVVSDRPAPPDEWALPQQDKIVAWFDPSLDGAVDYNEGQTEGVARLYSRTVAGVDKNDGAYWMGMQSNSGISGKDGRYPFMVETAYAGASGVAPTMKWMDFSKNGTGDSTGNTLRSHKLPDMSVTATTSEKMSFRSLFMALDSSIGGGNPVGDIISFNGKVKAREAYGAEWTKPIFGSGTTDVTHTWLDTEEVDGSTDGYNGRGEVLGFETVDGFTTTEGLFFGYYNPNHGQVNYEHIAETVIYSTPLAAEERLTVQKYLMAKWFGDMNGEFSDLSGATVTGAGNIKSAALRNLPAFDSGFTGGVFGGSAMTFRVLAQGGGSTVVDAIDIDHAVTLDSECNVTVKVLGGRLNPGEYTLLTATQLSGGDAINAIVVDKSGEPVSRCKVVKDGNRLKLIASSSGLMLILK